MSEAAKPAGSKTVSYKGTMYNVSNITKTSSKVDGRAGDNEIVGLRSIDKTAFESYVKEHGSVTVTTVIIFDEDEMVYQNTRVTKYKELEKVIKNLDSAMDEIAKFMGKNKASLLKLK
jgi:regulatory protein YycH of two-component signal transduction system YycFG